jgi:hypothetical protein
MAVENAEVFLQLLAAFPENVRETAVWLRELIWQRYPESNELIYGKSRGLAVGWGFTDKAGDIFVSFACYTKHVNLGFHHSNLLDDPRGLLEGSGNQYRHFKVGRIEDFPQAYMEALMDAAWMNVHSALKPKAKLSQGLTIVKSMPS